MSNKRAEEDRCSNGAHCPRVSVVMGCVIDIGESSREPDSSRAVIPFETVIKTTYPTSASRSTIEVPPGPRRWP
jgi:hypothetical protein